MMENWFRKAAYSTFISAAIVFSGLSNKDVQEINAFQQKRQPLEIKVLPQSYKKINERDFKALVDGTSKSKTYSVHNGDLEKRYICNFASVFSVAFYTNSDESTYQEIYCGNGLYLNNQGFLLTSAHVLSGKNKYNFALSFSPEKEPIVATLETIAYSRNKDLALCISDAKERFSKINVPSFRRNTLTSGNEMYTISFSYKPLTATNLPITSFSVDEKIAGNPFELFPLEFEKRKDIINIVFNGKKFKLGVITCGGKIEKDYAKRIFPEEMEDYSDLVSLMIHSEKGNSGASVFDNEGKVAGVLFLGATDSNWGAMMPSNVILEFLEKYQNYRFDEEKTR